MNRIIALRRLGVNLTRYWILALVILLSGCHSHHSKKDGPPNFYVDERKILNAVPRPEPLAKYGNMRSYRVFGKRYYTLRSSHNYSEVGIASWYGTQFNTHHTSSGERYNMLAMTAAHKTLPLPTYVEVTNLKNHRKIIVKVNDRGPFESNRLIDLSYVAAKKLGMLGHGTTRVRVTAIDTYHYRQHEDFVAKNVTHVSQRIHYSASAKSPKYNMYLQIGAFRNRYRAEIWRQQLASRLAAPIKIAYPTRNNHLYRVQVGPFRDVASTEKISHRLRFLGIKPNKINGG